MNIITLKYIFLGVDVVEWLETHVEGFQDRREARKYASHMLKAGYIKHTVNKTTFSEQCYYVFGDLLSAGIFLFYLYYLCMNSMVLNVMHFF